MRCLVSAAAVLLLAAAVFPHGTSAQAPASSSLLLLVAIEDPNGTDPTAKGINTTLYEALGGTGIQLAKSDKKYALDAIAQAPALCAASAPGFRFRPLREHSGA